ncbi:MAG: hydroxymethylglutaryl-CoA lyase [Steroidobacteraceae bacterium]
MLSESNQRVEIVEVGPRDGLQNETATLSTALKTELIQRLIQAGIHRIEVASFVNPKLVAQMADAEEVLAQVSRQPGVTRVGLVLNRRGLERAIAAGCDEVGLVAVATDSFGRHNQGADRERAIDICEELVPLAKSAGMSVQITLSVAFGCPYEGEVPAERVLDICKRLAALGPRELALADTIGVAVPMQVQHLFEHVRAFAPNLHLRGHFHNTRNTALANIMAAYQSGVRIFDSSIGGIGGCPFAPRASGNVATEDVVYLLERSGIRTGLSLARLIDTAQWLEHCLGHALPGMLHRAGEFPYGTQG